MPKGWAYKGRVTLPPLSPKRSRGGEEFLRDELCEVTERKD